MLQSNGARAAVAAFSVALIVVLFIVLRGGDDNETTGDTAPVTATTQEAEGTDADGATAAEKAQKQKQKQKQNEAAAADETVIKVVGGSPEGGLADISATKGEEVQFTVDSDVDEEVHVHGYDLYFDLKAGKETQIEFPAEIDGIFEVELHGSAQEIAELTVNP